jgi:hypothetical protein
MLRTVKARGGLGVEGYWQAKVLFAICRIPTGSFVATVKAGKTASTVNWKGINTVHYERSGAIPIGN